MRHYKPLRIEEVSVPDVGPADVLVKVAATGMCRSVTTLRLDDVNEKLEALARGDVVGRAVLVFD